MTLAQLEKRLDKVEERLAEINPAPQKKWWEAIAGTFANDPAFEEAARLGREYRLSLRSKPKAKPRRKRVHS